MRVLVDDTNPENDESLLYLSVIEVDEKFIAHREENPFGFDNIVFNHEGDIYSEFTTLASFVVDVDQNMAELVAKADETVKQEYFSDKFGLDERVVAINQVILDLITVTGSNGLYWPYG